MAAGEIPQQLQTSFKKHYFHTRLPEDAVAFSEAVCSVTLDCSLLSSFNSHLSQSKVNLESVECAEQGYYLCSFDFIIYSCWHRLTHSLKLVDAAVGIAVTFPVGSVPCRLMGDSAINGDYTTN